MLKAHIEDYRAHGCNLRNYSSDNLAGAPDPALMEYEKGQNDNITPNKLRSEKEVRYLDVNDPLEAEAYKHGYRILCGEEVYTLAEAREEGLI